MNLFKKNIISFIVILLFSFIILKTFITPIFRDHNQTLFNLKNQNNVMLLSNIINKYRPGGLLDDIEKNLNLKNINNPQLNRQLLKKNSLLNNYLLSNKEIKNIQVLSRNSILYSADNNTKYHQLIKKDMLNEIFNSPEKIQLTPIKGDDLLFENSYWLLSKRVDITNNKLLIGIVIKVDYLLDILNKGVLKKYINAGLIYKNKYYYKDEKIISTLNIDMSLNYNFYLNNGLIKEYKNSNEYDIKLYDLDFIKVHYQTRLDYQEQLIVYEEFKIFFIIMGLLCLLMLINTLITKKSLLNPLNIMKDQLYKIVDSNNVNIKLPLYTNDLKEFSSSINKFLRFIRKKKEDLEEDIFKRTKELSLYKKVIEESPATVIITDPNARIEFVNKKFTELTGYDLKEVIGKNPSILNSGVQSKEHYKDLWKTISRGDEWHGEFCNKAKDGKIFWEMASICPITDYNGEIINYVAVSEDITEQRIMREKLLKSKDTFRIVADYTYNWECWFDNFGKLIWTNPAVEALMGYTPDECFAMENFPMALFASEDLKRFMEDFNATINGCVGKDYLYRGLKKDGSTVWVAVTWNPVYDEDGESLGFRTSARDFSIRKKQEDELKSAKTDAENAAKAKSTFLANMSHEIRTPMNAIIGLNRLLKQTELTQRQDDYVTKIGRASQNLLGIINDILDYSKVEAGKLELENLEFNLDEVIENISAVVAMKAFDKGLEFIVKKDSDVPVNLVGDPLRLGQILLNLSNNAIKFTDNGEVMINIKLLKKSKNAVRLKFEVKDTGIGLSSDQKNKLFKAFSQADISTTRKYGGTGLGLSISKHLVKLMNGEIDVDSEYQKGSCFYFDVLFGTSKVVNSENILLPDNFKTINILIADPNKITRDIIDDYSKVFAKSIYKVSSTLELLEKYKTLNDNNEKIDLIFIDWKIDNNFGLSSYNKLLNLSKTEIKVILITSYGREDVIEEANKYGIKTVLMKPISQSMVYNAILSEFGIKIANLQKNILEMDYPENFDMIRGAKILLVEDNEINQLVAKETLEQEGFWVDIANNGLEASNMVQSQKDYDVILMDLQMPVMDGYEATELIKSDPSIKEIPIIALSADAMVGIKEKVKKAGMVDYITKPVNHKNLFFSLGKWIKPKKRKYYKRSEKYGDEIIDIDEIKHSATELDISNGLNRVNNNFKAYLEIVTKFKRNNEFVLDEILDYYNENKMKLAIRTAHSLKGSSGNIGAKNLYILAKNIELNLKSETVDKEILFSDLKKAKYLLNIINSEIDILINKEKVAEDNNELNKDLNRQELFEMLQVLKPLLESYDAEAEDILDRMLDHVKGSIYYDGIKKIKDLVVDYEYEKAIELLESINFDFVI